MCAQDSEAAASLSHPKSIVGNSKLCFLNDLCSTSLTAKAMTAACPVHSTPTHSTFLSDRLGQVSVPLAQRSCSVH